MDLGLSNELCLQADILAEQLLHSSLQVAAMLTLGLGGGLGGGLRARRWV